MTLHESRRQIIQLAVLIIVSSLVVISIVVVEFADSAHSSDQQERTAARTECVRERSSALDDARWTTIGALFSATSRADAVAIGARLGKLPTIETLSNKGGTVDRQHFGACPPPIAEANGSAATP